MQATSTSILDRFGQVTNFVRDVYTQERELDIREIEARNAANAQTGNSQIAVPVDTNGSPVQQGGGTIGGVKTSTLVLLGLGTLAIGGAVAIAKFA